MIIIKVLTNKNNKIKREDRMGETHDPFLIFFLVVLFYGGWWCGSRVHFLLLKVEIFNLLNKHPLVLYIYEDSVCL